MGLNDKTITMVTAAKTSKVFCDNFTYATATTIANAVEGVLSIQCTHTFIALNFARRLKLYHAGLTVVINLHLLALI